MSYYVYPDGTITEEQLRETSIREARKKAETGFLYGLTQVSFLGRIDVR